MALLLLAAAVLGFGAERNHANGSSLNEIAPMVIIGEGWSVQLIIQNAEETATTGVLKFFRADGSEWDVPLTTHQTVDGELPLTFLPYQTVVVQTAVRFDAQQLGWAQMDMQCCNDYQGQIVYRKQQADRPDLMTTTPFGADFNRTAVFFDNTEFKISGVGLVNSDRRSEFLSNEEEVDVLIRDADGNVIGQHKRIIENQHFHWFSLAAEYPETANRRGTITFESELGDLTAFSLQFTPNGAFTSVTPVETFK